MLYSSLTSYYVGLPNLQSFPTRRSSDLITKGDGSLIASAGFAGMAIGASLGGLLADRIGRRSVFALTLLIYGVATGDRKSTRLNSSHVAISYAVLCLKKKIIGTTGGCSDDRRQRSAEEQRLAQAR